MKKNKTIKAWCFKNIETGILEPIQGMDFKNKGTRWSDGYSIWETKKKLLDNVWKKIPEGYKPVQILLRLEEK